MTDNPSPQKRTAADGHEYHVSSTANAKVAPTNAATLANATKSKGLDTDQQEFLTILDYEWNMQSRLDPEQIRQDYGITQDLWESYTHNPAMLEALKLRGVPTAGLNPAINSGPVGTLNPVGPNPAPKITAKLTPIQLVVANSLLDLEDTRSVKKKLQDVGCTTTQYNAWMRNDDFRHYLQARAEQLLGSDLKHEALLALADRVKSGDMKAIEYYNEMTGRYVRQTQSNSSGPDVSLIVTRIIEIIVDEVEDQITVARIANRLKGLIAGTQVASALINPSDEITIPTIAPPREITPEVKALMDKGVGYDN